MAALAEERGAEERGEVLVSAQGELAWAVQELGMKPLGELMTGRSVQGPLAAAGALAPRAIPVDNLATHLQRVVVI